MFHFPFDGMINEILDKINEKPFIPYVFFTLLCDTVKHNSNFNKHLFTL